MKFLPYPDYLRKPIRYAVILIILLVTISNQGFTQSLENRTLIDSLKKLSMEQLMDIEVTSVSKRPEKLKEVASAIQVITQEDIHRSGATCLAEALRLSPNLQVAQLNAYSWIISARGFNNVFSNKLLVMIDGRTVYTPLLAGVYWDVQSVLLEDVDHIEVISGPGGTLWGANAVNGVINIITKKAKDTQGLYVSGAAGSSLHSSVAARYGGSIGSKFNYRVFAQRNDRDPTLLANGKDNTDDWNLTQGGLRMDWTPTEMDNVSLQANFQGGTEHTKPGPSTFDGQNVLGQWAHSFSNKSDLAIQAYFDRTWRRDLPSTISDQLQTYDLDIQYHFLAGKNNNIVWGGGYRLMQDESQHSTIFVGLVPEKKDLVLYNTFIQDEITIVPNEFKLTLGTKLSHNVYTGFEIQPSARLAWTPDKNNTLWAAVSRAVRTPSRIDVDYHLPTYTVPPGSPNVNGGPDFNSEKVIAYEAGYRVQPAQQLSLSLAAFYNQYDDLYSVEALPGTLTYQIQNGVKGSSQGIELSGTYQAFTSWKVRGGYTYFNKNLVDKPGHTFDTTYEGSDPKHQVILQSMLDLFKHFQVDVIGRYVSSLPPSVVSTLPKVPAYANFDLRLAWQYKTIELALIGQNLANNKHTEFGPNSIPRNIYGKVTWRL